MTIKFIFRFIKLLSLAAFFVFISCGKDGAPGPKGETGDKGAKGDKGDEGPQGATGTANVMYSPWMDLEWNSNNNSTFRQMVVQIPEVSEEFLENGGIVMVYLKTTYESIIEIRPLPIEYDYSSMLYKVYFLQESAEDFSRGISIELSSKDGSVPLPTYQDTPEFNFDVRYILIPGGVALPGMRTLNSSNLGLNSIDYKTIKSMFNIID